MFGTERGFTLIEGVMAMGLFTVAGLGIIRLQVESIRVNRFGGHLAQASLLAEERANLLLSLDFDDTRLSDANSGNNPAWGVSFASPLSTAADPSGVAESTTAIEYLSADGLTVAQNLAVFQRYWQVADQDINTTTSGADSKRIRVAVRFRNGVDADWHESSIVVLKAKPQ